MLQSKPTCVHIFSISKELVLHSKITCVPLQDLLSDTPNFNYRPYFYSAHSSRDCMILNRTCPSIGASLNSLVGLILNGHDPPMKCFLEPFSHCPCNCPLGICSGSFIGAHIISSKSPNKIFYKEALSLRIIMSST